MKPVKIGELVICGTNYTIEAQAELFRDDKLDGCIVYNDCLIQIEKKIIGDRRNEVLMHEVVHAIDSALHLHMKEDDVQRMANGLHALGVSKFLMEKVRG